MIGVSFQASVTKVAPPGVSPGPLPTVGSRQVMFKPVLGRPREQPVPARGAADRAAEVVLCREDRFGWPVIRRRQHVCACGSWQRYCYTAEWNKAPSMYEMEGALFGLATLGRPVARLTRRRAPPARARYPREAPVSWLFPRPRVAPRWCPFPTVKVFLLPPPEVTQESAAIHFKFFLHPHNVHRTPAVIRTWRRLSTALCTAHPQAT